MAINLPTETVKCATCQGTGAMQVLKCGACDGKGQILVAAPPIPCPRCKGTGKSSESDMLSRSQTCAVCLGTGWARIIWDQMDLAE
jgi:DnaJ-class molecular chaperone